MTGPTVRATQDTQANALRSDPANAVANVFFGTLATIALVAAVVGIPFWTQKVLSTAIFVLLGGAAYAGRILTLRGRHVLAMHAFAALAATLSIALMAVSLHLTAPTLIVMTVLAAYAAVCGLKFALAFGVLYLAAAILLQIARSHGVEIPVLFPTQKTAEIMGAAIAMVGILWPLSLVFHRIRQSILAVDAENRLREAAERQSRQSEEQLRSLGDNLPEGFIYQYQLLGARSGFLYISGGVTTILGLKPEVLMADAKPLLDLIDERSFRNYLVEESRSARDLTDFSGTLQFNLPDERKVWLQLRSRPRRQADGSTLWDGVALDVTERRRADEELQRIKAIVDASDDAILGKTLDGIITNWNHGAERMFGHAARDAVGQHMSLLVPPDLAAEERDILARIARGERVDPFETVRLHDDGHRIEIAVTVSPIFDADGRVVGASTIERDVTERRLAEARLRESEALFRSYFELPLIGMTISGADRRWRDANERACEILGYPREALLGKSWVEMTHPEDVQLTVELSAMALAGQRRIYSLEKRFIRGDGSVVPVELSTACVRDASGQPAYFVSLIQDITDRVAARERILRQARFYRCLSECNEATARCTSEGELFETICRVAVDAAGMRLAWIGIVGPDGMVEVVERSGPAVGYLDGIRVSTRAEEVSGRGPTGTAIRTDTPMWCQDFESNPLTNPWRVPGRKFGIRSSAALPIRRGGRAVGALTIYSDELGAFDAETQRLLLDLVANLSFALDNFDREALRRQAEVELEAHRLHLEETVERRTQELANARERAEAASVAKSAFLANMSHEIRTPLNAVIGLAHLIRQGGLSAEQEERLGKLEGAADHLLAIINAILDLSKIEAGKFTLEESPVKVESVIANVRSILEERAAAAGLQLIIESGVYPDNLLGDATRLQQALLNYANNSVKFTRSGTVTLRAHVIEDTIADSRIRFEVQDTGIGIEPSDIARLFGAFEQGDTSTTRPSGGTGLGLAITRKLAELMGGEAGAQSTPGAGSTFWFTCRLRKATATTRIVQPRWTRDDASSIIRRDYRGARILLAEDNELNQEVARAILEDVGLVVDIAGDGVEAVARAISGNYAVVLMDMQMPNLDGLDASREIRQHRSSAVLPIVAMTANAFGEDKARCYAAGMDDFVGKPVEPSLLYSVLLNWLKRSRAGAVVPR